VAGHAAEPHFRGKAFTAFHLLPFIIPTVLRLSPGSGCSTRPSALSTAALHLGVITGRINWLGDPDLAMISISSSTSGRGVPFFAISLLAGLQTISPNSARPPPSMRQAVASGSGTSLAAVAAGDHGSFVLFSVIDLRRLPDRLCETGGGRPTQPPVRHLRLSDRYRHRSF